MYTLVFDTTGYGVGIGLYNDNKPVQKIQKVMEFGQAEELAVGVANVLANSGLSFNNVDYVAVCTGPGSFTGVRAGLSFARGLALDCPNLKLTGISAFEIYAAMLPEGARAYYNAVVIETKREDFYFQLFDADMNKISEPAALTRDEIIQQLKSRQVSFIGDGVERLLSVSSGLQIKHVELTEMTEVDALFQAAKKKYFAKCLDFPKPLYIRGADTCVK